MRKPYWNILRIASTVVALTSGVSTVAIAQSQENAQQRGYYNPDRQTQVYAVDPNTQRGYYNPDRQTQVYAVDPNSQRGYYNPDRQTQVYAADPNSQRGYYN